MLLEMQKSENCRHGEVTVWMLVIEVLKYQINCHNTMSWHWEKGRFKRNGWSRSKSTSIAFPRGLQKLRHQPSWNEAIFERQAHPKTQIWLKVYFRFILIIVLKHLVYKVLKLCVWLFPETRKSDSILLRQGSWTFDMFYVFYSQGGRKVPC